VSQFRNGVTRAVRAEEGEDLSPSHLEIDARDRFVAAVALNQAADADHRLGLGQAGGCLIYAVFLADAVHLARTALERILEGHLPYPAVIVDRYGDLVAANDGFGALTGGVAPELLAPPVSVARVLLHPRGMAPLIANCDEWAWHVIDRMHEEMARNPSGRLNDLVTELEELVPDRPRQPGLDYLGFAVPLRLRSSNGELRLLTTLTHFGTAVDVTIAELRLEAFLPADEATASILTELAGRRRGAGSESAAPHPASAR
jgi:hypothetical protein